MQLGELTSGVAQMGAAHVIEGSQFAGRQPHQDGSNFSGGPQAFRDERCFR